MRAGSFGLGEDGAAPVAAEPSSSDPYSNREDARATFAAARDERQRARLGTARNIGVAAAVALAALGYVFLQVQVRPFRYWDAVCVVAVAILPAELALACFVAQDHPVALAAALARRRAKGGGDWLNVAAGIGVFGLLLPVNGVLYLNQVFDRAPATTQSLVVQRTWSTSGRHGTTWYAGVVPTARPPLRFASFYADQPVVVSRRTWDTLQPGRSTLMLVVHPGLIGLPWYETSGTTLP